MSLKVKNNFEKLVNSIYQTHCVLQENAAKAINYNLTVRNWLIGCYIIEYEQNGDDRAKYGTRLLEEIAKKLKNKGLKGLHRRALNSRSLLTQIKQRADMKNSPQIADKKLTQKVAWTFQPVFPCISSNSMQ